LKNCGKIREKMRWYLLGYGVPAFESIIFAVSCFLTCAGVPAITVVLSVASIPAVLFILAMVLAALLLLTPYTNVGIPTDAAV